MEIRFYSGFKKRLNSTKQPTTASLTLTGTLKEACSIENPVISIEIDTSPAQYVYAYIPDFGRYYFVNDWVSNLGLWECHLSEDYLASWKTDIGNTNAYIDRCASESDGTIVDTEYITTNAFNISAVAAASPWNAEGCFILGVINSQNSGSGQLGGAVTYYVLTASECANLMSYLLSTNFLSDIGFPSVQQITQDISQEMAKAFIKPIDYIVSCMWVPLPYTIFYGQNSPAVQIKVGYWQIATNITSGHIVETWAAVPAYQVTIPNHPQAAARGEYLNFAPYSRYDFFIPPFGSVPIDSSCRSRGNILTAYMAMDPISGIGNLVITCDETAAATNFDNSPIVAQAAAQIGVPIQLSQVNTDIFHAGVETIQAGISGASMLTSALTLNAGGVMSGLSSTISHLASAVDYMAPQVRSHGADGCRIYTTLKARLSCTFLPLVDEDNAEMGRPLRKIRTIKNLSGFIKCFEVTVDYACFDSEKQEILNHLLSGFFYE